MPTYRAKVNIHVTQVHMITVDAVDAEAAMKAIQSYHDFKNDTFETINLSKSYAGFEKVCDDDLTPEQYTDTHYPEEG